MNSAVSEKRLPGKTKKTIFAAVLMPLVLMSLSLTSGCSRQEIQKQAGGTLQNIPGN